MDIQGPDQLLQICLGETISASLCDGSVLRGTLLSFDGAANLVLQGAVQECFGVSRRYPTVFVRGDNVKYLTKLSPNDP